MATNSSGDVSSDKTSDRTIDGKKGDVPEQLETLLAEFDKMNVAASLSEKVWQATIDAMLKEIRDTHSDKDPDSRMVIKEKKAMVKGLKASFKKKFGKEAKGSSGSHAETPRYPLLTFLMLSLFKMQDLWGKGTVEIKMSRRRLECATSVPRIWQFERSS